MRRLLVFALCLATFAGTAFAQGARTLSYQGVLTDSGGVVAPDGPHDMVFRLYDESESLLWEEALTVPTLSGRFNVVLGETESLEGLAFDEAYSLGISVDGDPEMTPREPLTAAPYSLSARTVEGGLVRSVNGIQQDVTLVAGSNVTITPVGSDIEIAAIGGPPVSVTLVAEEFRADAGDTDDALFLIAVMGPSGPITGLDSTDFSFATIWGPAGGAAIDFFDFAERGNGIYSFRGQPVALTWKVGGYQFSLVVSTASGQGNTVAMFTVDR